MLDRERAARTRETLDLRFAIGMNANDSEPSAASTSAGIKLDVHSDASFIANSAPPVPVSAEASSSEGELLKSAASSSGEIREEQEREIVVRVVQAASAEVQEIARKARSEWEVLSRQLHD